MLVGLATIANYVCASSRNRLCSSKLVVNDGSAPSPGPYEDLVLLLY